MMNYTRIFLVRRIIVKWNITIGHNSDYGQGRTCPPRGEDKLILGRAREYKLILGRTREDKLVFGRAWGGQTCFGVSMERVS